MRPTLGEAYSYWNYVEPSLGRLRVPRPTAPRRRMMTAPDEVAPRHWTL